MEALHNSGVVVVDMETAYSDRSRSAFRTDGDRDSNLMAITIPK